MKALSRKLVPLLGLALLSCTPAEHGAGDEITLQHAPPRPSASYAALPAGPAREALERALLSDGQGETVLPKWKTTQEKAAERLAWSAQAAGLSPIDTYSDYRDKNISKFFITKAPVSKSFRKPAEYEQQQAYMLNWISSVYYQNAAYTKLFTEIIKGARIPMPNIGTMLIIFKVWRTYTNALAVVGPTQKVLLIPTYSDETSNEAAAMTAYAKAFPGWKLVKIDSKVIIPNQGAIHCITMQIPLGDKGKMEADPGALCGSTAYYCVKTGCGNISTVGCCDGEIRKYCAGGKLWAKDCANSPKCGWDSAKSWYACGTSGAADPKSSHSKSCHAVTDAAMPDQGGNDQGVPDATSPDLSLPDQSPPDQGVPDATSPDLSLPDQSPPDQAAADSAVAPDKGHRDMGEDGGVDPQDPAEGCDCSLGEPGKAPPVAPLLLLLLLGRRKRRTKL